MVIREATADDADALFALVKDFATSFKPERQAFDIAFGQFLADESVWLHVA